MKTLEERFWSKVEVKGEDECWLWSGAQTRGGYGHIQAELKGYRTMTRCNRVAWYLHTGENPGSKHVLHTCDNPLCVNPKHLFLGTHQDNMSDKVSKGRGTYGFSSKITMTDAEEIRKLYKETGMTQKSIGEIYGLKPHTVSLIVNNKRWVKR